MAALVHRAHDLGIMSDEMYGRAMRQRSAYGWRRVEPGHDLRPTPQPSLVARGMEAAGMLLDDVAALAGIPIAVARRIGGSGPKPVVRV